MLTITLQCDTPSYKYFVPVGGDRPSHIQHNQPAPLSRATFNCPDILQHSYGTGHWITGFKAVQWPLHLVWWILNSDATAAKNHDLTPYD